MLLGPDAVVGSVGGLYASVDSLERSYAQPGADMDALLRPLVPPPAYGAVGPLLRLPEASARPRCLYCGGRPPRAASQDTQLISNRGGTYTPVLQLHQVYGTGHRLWPEEGSCRAT
ncbi:unnamed protein product [Urochloa humidicola]